MTGPPPGPGTSSQKRTELPPGTATPSLPGTSSQGAGPGPSPQSSEDLTSPSQCSTTPMKEIDSSTYVTIKTNMRQLANFTFKVQSHSPIKDKDGNMIFVLHCGNKQGQRFKIPITYSDTDNLQDIYNIIKKYKKGQNATLSLEEAKIARIHTMIRADIDEYLSLDSAHQKEMLVLDSLGFKTVEGLGVIYVVGPNQVLLVENDPNKEEILRKMGKCYGLDLKRKI